MNARRRKTLFIREADTLRALRAPIRQELVDALGRRGDCSVKELADDLGRPAAALYYHIHELEAVGIIVESGKKPAGKRTESAYSLTADRIMLDRDARSTEFLTALNDLHRSALRKAERDLERAIGDAAGSAKQRDKAASLLRLSARLRPGKAAQARRMMLELVQFMSDNNDPGAGDTYSLTLAFARLPERTAND